MVALHPCHLDSLIRTEMSMLLTNAKKHNNLSNKKQTILNDVHALQNSNLFFVVVYFD